MCTRPRHAVLLFALICLFTAGCAKVKEGSKTLSSLAKVRSELIKTFADNNIDVNLNSIPGHSSISINFVNSPLNERTVEERDIRAQQTVEIVKSRFGDIKSLNEIHVMFSREITYFVLFHSRRPVDFYSFDNDGRPIRGNVVASAPGPAIEMEEQLTLTPHLSYSPAQRQTEIFVDGIQLEGVADNGLTMVPHLTVEGDAHNVTPRAPAFIRFDFASFAAKPIFPGLTNIAFVGDQIKYQTEGQFTTSRSNDGLTSEFLYLTVPYSMFRQMSAGKALTLKLGEKNYQLTVEQLQALKKMRQYVKED